MRGWRAGRPAAARAHEPPGAGVGVPEPLPERRACGAAARRSGKAGLGGEIRGRHLALEAAPVEVWVQARNAQRANDVLLELEQAADESTVECRDVERRTRRTSRRAGRAASCFRSTAGQPAAGRREYGDGGRHRKLKPTGAERPGLGRGRRLGADGSRTPSARIGGLICWENYMPLARVALQRQGVTIHLAPTADTQARMAIDDGAYRAREPRLRARVQSGHHQAGLPARVPRPPGDWQPSRTFSAAEAASSSLRWGRYSPDRSGTRSASSGATRSSRDRPRALRLRPVRALRAPGRVSLRGPGCSRARALRRRDRRGDHGGA